MIVGITCHSYVILYSKMELDIWLQGKACIETKQRVTVEWDKIKGNSGSKCCKTVHCFEVPGIKITFQQGVCKILMQPSGISSAGCS